MKKYNKLLSIITLLSCAFALADQVYWTDCDWKPVSQFPEGFVFGAGHSHLQYEGARPGHEANDYNNWHILENSNIKPGLVKCGAACKGWEKALDDVDLVYDIGLDAYRMSVSWEKIMPTPDGKPDQEALDHYIQVLDKCNTLGIKVLMGLHHYTDPAWFTKKGGWTKKENIKYFARFARMVYQAFGDRVFLWATFNSPSGYASKCFLTGDMIAAIDENNKYVCKEKDFDGHANMLCNLCLAHVEVYHTLKEEFNTLKEQGVYTHEPQIGILKNMIQMETDRFDIIGNIGSYVVDHLLDGPMFEFFTTGVYPHYYMKSLFKDSANPIATDPRGPFSHDFIGLNYYSHMALSGSSKQKVSGEIETQNSNYTIYPEGIYRALVTINNELVQPIQSIWHTTGIQKELPIYVTENGIAAEKPEHREIFFTRYLYAVNKAIEQDNINVKGYFTWALMDNYEWGSAYTEQVKPQDPKDIEIWKKYQPKQYGLYKVDFNDPNRTRTLKTDAGTQYFLNVVNNTKST